MFLHINRHIGTRKCRILSLSDSVWDTWESKTQVHLTIFAKFIIFLCHWIANIRIKSSPHIHKHEPVNAQKYLWLEISGDNKAENSFIYIKLFVYYQAHCCSGFLNLQSTLIDKITVENDVLNEKSTRERTNGMTCFFSLLHPSRFYHLLKLKIIIKIMSYFILFTPHKKAICNILEWVMMYWDEILKRTVGGPKSFSPAVPSSEQ